VTTAQPLSTERSPGGVAEIKQPNPTTPHYAIPEWQEQFGLVAGITGRDGGFDLGLKSPDPIGSVMERWSALRNAVGPGFRATVIGHQIHGSHIRTYLDPLEGWVLTEGVDGHCATVPGVLLCVSVADCIPVYLAHPSTGAVALLHAGWRGVVAGVLEAGVRRLTTLTGCNVSDLVMHCGIGICGGCYEVGSEVRSQLLGPKKQSAGKVDLRDVLQSRAHAAGIHNVTISTWCTAHDNDRFYSHRRSGGSDGRMVAYLGRPATLS
jgi:polyphenol oxidase